MTKPALGRDHCRAEVPRVRNSNSKGSTSLYLPWSIWVDGHFSSRSAVARSSVTRPLASFWSNDGSCARRRCLLLPTWARRQLIWVAAMRKTTLAAGDRRWQRIPTLAVDEHHAIKGIAESTAGRGDGFVINGSKTFVLEGMAQPH